MAVQVETLEKLERRITLTVASDVISGEVESRLKRLSRTAKRIKTIADFFGLRLI